MRVIIEDKARRFILAQGGRVTVVPPTPPMGWRGGLPAQVAPQAPEGRLARLYQRQEVDGVEVFLPPGLMLNAPALTIRLAGFWRFKWLRVLGVASPAACAC